jgi:hypothetical protein
MAAALQLLNDTAELWREPSRQMSLLNRPNQLAPAHLFFRRSSMPLTLPMVDPHAQELNRRLRGPQRHRLLHGYPRAAAMCPRRGATPDDVRFDPADELNSNGYGHM